MIRFFSENWGTILVLALVAAAVAGVLINSYRARKAGKSGCGCGCGDCPSKGICHPDK
ncbi:MAG: FeoB-associated Cys-rich membrane protein [Clostridiales bacterium]|nr:FeoB-associated Cys-rich membrane protein [Clostridiales bacterium]